MSVIECGKAIISINGKVVGFAHGFVKADLGPYASRLYKFDLYNDEEHRLDTSKGLKFLHFNTSEQLRNVSKKMFDLYQSRTVAVVALSPNGVQKTAQDFLDLAPDTDLMISMLVGVTFLSKHDNYSRQTGRDESVKKMVEIDMKVTGLTVTETHIFVHLAPHQGVVLSLRMNKKTGFSTVTGQLTKR